MYATSRGKMSSRDFFGLSLMMTGPEAAMAAFTTGESCMYLQWSFIKLNFLSCSVVGVMPSCLSHICSELSILGPGLLGAPMKELPPCATAIEYVTPEGLKLVTCDMFGGALEGWRVITGLGSTWTAATAKVNGLGESGQMAECALPLPLLFLFLFFFLEEPPCSPCAAEEWLL